MSQQNALRYHAYRSLVAALLLAVLLPMFTVKALHFHSESPHACCYDTPLEGTALVKATHSDCPICDVSLPPFETALVLRLTPYFFRHALVRSLQTPTTAIVFLLSPKAHSPPFL